MITLSQTQARLSEALALCEAAAETVNSLALGTLVCTDPTARAVFVAKLAGHNREVKVLRKIESDLIASGRADENALRILSPSDASQPRTALITPSLNPNASIEVRGASRVALSSPSSEPFPFSAGDGF